MESICTRYHVIIVRSGGGYHNFRTLQKHQNQPYGEAADTQLILHLTVNPMVQWAPLFIIHIIVYLHWQHGHLGYRLWEVFSSLVKNMVNLQTNQLTQPVANTIGHHCMSWLSWIQYIGCTIIVGYQPFVSYVHVVLISFPLSFVPVS